MSILSGFLKTKKHRKMADGNYKLQSEWTSASTVEMADGNTAETNLGAIQGITDSLTATSSNIALSAKAGNDLQGQIDDVNSNLTQTNQSLGEYKFLPRYDAVIGTMTAPSQEYTCDCNCFLIGTIKGTSVGWASVRSVYSKTIILLLKQHKMKLQYVFRSKKETRFS